MQSSLLLGTPFGDIDNSLNGSSSKKELRYYQNEALEASVNAAKRGVMRQAIVLPTGMGKTKTASHAPERHEHRKVLWMAHREELINQARGALAEANPNLRVQIDQADFKADHFADIVVASVPGIGRKGSRRLSQFDDDHFQQLVVDECFVAGTLVEGRPIETFAVGDPIRTRRGWRKVGRVFKSQPQSLVTVTFADGRSFTCTPGHPIYTHERGWIPAVLLARESRVYVINEANEDYSSPMRSMWSDGGSERQEGAGASANGESLLLQRASTHVVGRSVVGANGANESSLCFGAHEAQQPNGLASEQGEDEGDPSLDRVEAARAWGQRNGLDGSREEDGGSFGMETAHCLDKNGEGVWIPNSLQDRLGKSGAQDRDRDRRVQPRVPRAQGAGSEEGGVFTLQGVDRVTLHEPTSDGTFGGLCPDGFVYNLGVASDDEEDHNYFANGVLVHNCHHALAPTYINAINRFRGDNQLLLCLTATPYRSDKQLLSNLCDEVVYEFPLRRAMEEGWLCGVKSFRVKTATDISAVGVSAGDFAEGELADTINTDYRNSVIISAIEDHLSECKCILVFCANVAHVKEMTRQLIKRGHTAEYIVGDRRDCSPEERRAILQRFHNGATRILVNCSVASEGFDEPRIDGLVLAKPTKSPLLATQMLGRCLRTHPDKPSGAIVLDIVDVCGRHKIQTAAEVFGIREVDCLGQDMLEVVKECEQAAKVGIEVKDGDDIEEIRRKRKAMEELLKPRSTVFVSTIAQAIDLFNAALPSDETQSHSEFPWIRGTGMSYLLFGGEKQFVLTQDTLGFWFCEVREKGGGQPKVYPCGATASVPFKKADSVVKKNSGTWTTPNGFTMPNWKSMTNNAAWKGQPPTEKQVRMLKQLGVHALPPDVNKGTASALLSYLLNRKRNPELWSINV